MERVFPYEMRLGESLVNFTNFDVNMNVDVIGVLLMNQRRALFHGFIGTEDRRQGLIIDLDKFEGLQRRLFVYGRDACHILPNVSDPVHRYHRVILRVFEHPPFDAVRIGRRHDGLHARKLQRPARVDI